MRLFSSKALAQLSSRFSLKIACFFPKMIKIQEGNRMNRYDFIKSFLKIKAEVVMIDMISEKLLALAVHVLLRDGLREHSSSKSVKKF